jgi:hypothetical protein
MSILGRVVAAVKPPESQEKKREARKKAWAVARRNDWLAQVLGHHEQIESLFAAVRAAQEAAGRQQALRELAVVLNGHASAEEAVIYPALVHFDHKTHAMAGYMEHGGAKANLGEMEYLDPMSAEFLGKLEHVRSAVAHHMYEEEKDRFLDLKRISPADQTQLTARYMEEFHRYVNAGEEAELEFGTGRINAIEVDTLRPGGVR